MSGPLEKFIQDNREKFDSDAPDPRVWEKIKEKMNPEKEKTIPIRSLPFKYWMAAAAVLVFVGLSNVLYYYLKENKPEINIAGTKPAHVDSGNHLQVVNTPVDTTSNLPKKDVVVPQNTNPGNQNQASPKIADNNPPDFGDNKEMYYYTKLIEIKHEELKTLEKDEPLLYRQFSGDVQKLDSVYHLLKTQIPNNSNRELVIEAMISNLQLQIGLLNKQLGIIKQIKHSKKSAYEKAYKSV
jgi:hypothetical protein